MSDHRTRVFTSSCCRLHAPSGPQPESPSRLTAILDHLAAADRPIEEVSAHRDTDERLAQVHTPEYVGRFERAVQRGDGILDSADNPLSAGTFEAARAAVDVVLRATDEVAAGGRAFAAVRPPGHHAERELAMGFCYFANVACAAEQLLTRHGCERVAVVDFDVHHGNGTQHLFEARSDVHFSSLHQFPFYPGTGAADERGVGAGEGFTLNLPLPAGSGDAEYRAAFDDSLLPALEAYRPEVLLVSAGFDAWQRDPLGGMAVSREGFAEWGGKLGELAERLSDGRVLWVLEGGYDVTALPGLVEAHLAAADA